MRARCFVCGERATIAFGVRARHESTNAVWAPNAGVYLCGLHSVSGCKLQIRIIPAEDGCVRITTRGPLGETSVVHVIGGTDAGGRGQTRLEIA